MHTSLSRHSCMFAGNLQYTAGSTLTREAITFQPLINGPASHEKEYGKGAEERCEHDLVRCSFIALFVVVVYDNPAD
jgi:hypothetical protein